MASISQELREAVLQAAIQGKLTEQLPEDGDARDLLAQIKAEKERMIKEKKIKKEKPLEPISEDEVPFDVPKNWEWVRLGYISRLITKGTTPRGGNVSYTESGVGFLRAENVAGMDRLDKTNLKCIDIDTHFGFLQRSILEAGDILITIAGTLGRTALVRETDLPLNMNQAVSLVRMVNTRLVDLLYLIMTVNSPAIQKSLVDQRRVTAIPNLTLEIISNYLIPLPPLAEQHRIVARVEELLAKIDELEKVENELKALHQAFSSDMKTALLQAAMQGKLTEQLPEDGNAEDLLKQIKAEKEHLVTEKKIKKEKSLAPISEDEALFDIPENWQWCYLGDIFNHNAGKALNARNTEGEKHKYITTSNVYWDHFELENLREMYYTPDEVEKYSVRKGDLLVLEGGDIGRTAIWDREETYCVQNHVHRLRPYVELAVKYFYYCMMFYKNNGMINGKGIAIQGLSANALHCINIPLPPLAEQRRIVERLDKLLPLCDSLQAEL